MKFVVMLAGKSIPVDVRQQDNEYVINLDGHERRVNAIRATGQSYSLLVEGRSYEVGIEKNRNRYSVNFFDDTIDLEIFEALKFKAREVTKKSAVAGPSVISSPMPGKVVKLLVEPGDAVLEGQPLIVIEAMKMQNELKALRDGVIKQVNAKPGEVVSFQQTLIIID